MAASPTPPPYSPGLFSRMMCYLFGSNWPKYTQRYAKTGKILIGSIAASSVEMATKINAIHWHWLSDNWPHFVALAMVLSPILSTAKSAGAAEETKTMVNGQ